MLTNGGLIVKKQEMTRLWQDGKMIPVTLVKVCDQEVVRYKTADNDGYDAMVVGADKKESQKEKGQKVKYGYMCEYHVDGAMSEQHTNGSALTADLLSGVEQVRVISISKGKGFQGVMKRHNFGGGPATHGSKFHRAGGSTGNRKPRRTIRGWKMAGHMGSEKITLRSVPVIDRWEHEGEQFIALKGSIPGAYNSYVQLVKHA